MGEQNIELPVNEQKTHLINFHYKGFKPSFAQRVSK